MARESARDGHSPEEGPPLVDEAAQRALRAAVRPGLPNAAAAAPIVVGFVSASRAETSVAPEAIRAGMEAPPAEDALGSLGEGTRPVAAMVVEPPATVPSVAFAQPPQGRGASFSPWGAVEPSALQGVPSALLPVSETVAVPAAPAVVVQAGDAAVFAEPPLAPPASAAPRGEEPVPVADPPALAVSDAVTDEDVPVALAISARIADRDGLGGETLSILISGLPPGARLSAGLPLGDGRWKLAPRELEGLMLTPGQHWSGEAVLEVRAISSVGNGVDAVTVEEIALRVGAVADAPDAAAADARGSEDSWIPLAGLSAGLVDRDGSETLAITLLGVPAGATLSAGTRQGDGAWSLRPEDLAGLCILPTPDASGTYALTLVVTATEAAGGTATVARPFSLTVEAVADEPSVAAGGAGAEDTAIPLGAIVAATDLDGSETIAAIRLLGVPAGATLSAGTVLADGSWSLGPGDLPGLTLTPPPHFSGEIALSLVATSAE
ncbi:MAG: hypothetical protein MUC89_02635, partial [Acetobacteraceae bacterium]|nr:hypothetical protein [Acetobacteraceae bacterium]